MPSEIEKKHVQLEMFENHYPDFLTEARRIARWGCHKNEGFKRYGIPYTVASDFVREHMLLEKGLPGQNNVMGSVFRKGFVKVGYRPSKTPGSHATLVCLWTVPAYLKAVRDFQEGQNE